MSRNWNRMNPDPEQMEEDFNKQKKILQGKNSTLKQENSKLKLKKKKIIISFSIILFVTLTSMTSALLITNLNFNSEEFVNEEWLSVFVFDENGKRDFNLDILNNGEAIVYVSGDYTELIVLMFSECEEEIYYNNVIISLENNQVFGSIEVGASSRSLRHVSFMNPIVKLFSLNIYRNYLMSGINDG